jgi:exodeoxyribonuclease VII small subunit
MAEGKYHKSVKRLEEIIEKIENETIDVDELAASVKEAVGLIESCKERIERAELEVKKVVEGFKADQDKD